MTNPQPGSIDQVQEALRQQLYIAGRALATSIYLALKLRKPLLVEGEAGVGKTEIAKVLAAMLGRPLIRLQCYEGLGCKHRGLRVELCPADARDPAVGGQRAGG